MLMKILILVKIAENIDFGQNCRKNLGQICRKFSILAKTYQNVDFGQN